MRLLCFAFALFAAPAFAQAKPLDPVYACTSLADSAARLTCFDAAVAGLKQAGDAGNFSVVTREQIEKAETEAFGLSIPSLTALVETPSAAPAATSTTPGKASGQKLATLDKVTLAIKEVGKMPDGKYRFTMENGQVWRQTDGMRLSGMSEKNLTAEIRKAALGNFMMKIGNRTAIRVKRME